MEQAELLRQVIRILQDQNIVYMLVGSLASGVYGEPRMTRDIDIVVELRPQQVSGLCGAFPSPEFYVSEQAAREAVASPGQFHVIHPGSGNKVDFIVAKQDPWGRRQIERRRQEQVLPDQLGFAAAPEDVILGKLLFYREGGSEKHLRDVAGMLQMGSEQIDAEYIEQWSRQLGLAEEWRAVLNRLRDRG